MQVALSLFSQRPSKLKKLSKIVRKLIFLRFEAKLS